MQSNNRNLSDFLKQTFFNSSNSENLTSEPDIFTEYCIFTVFCITFLRGLILHVENNSQSARSNFAALKNYMLNVSLTKTEQNT